MTLLAVERLRKAFGGVEAVAEVSFRVSAGEMVAMIGPNGAGKSTCFNLIDRRLDPDGGRVLIVNQDTAGLPPHAISRLGVGRTFQVPATFASMTVRENVQTALLSYRRRLWALMGVASRLYREDADQLLQRVGIADQADRPCGVLAYGDLKRLELAVALANEPVLLLMDEPTAGMAPRERGELMTLVSSIVRERNTGVLFTEHDMDVVFGHADRILVMHRGALIAAGDPASVRANPRVNEVYLGSV